MAEIDISRLKEKLENDQRKAQLTLRAQLLAAKSEAIAKMQQKTITAEEYAQVTGETFAATMKGQYELEVAQSEQRMRDRVVAGYISPEEYAVITGKVYAETEE